MRAVVGVQVIAGGTVTVLGEEAGSPGLRHRVGYLTQAPSVYGDLSVRDNVGYIARIMGVGADAVDRAIASVDLTDHAHVKVENLSGGQQSRASLACTLVGDPEVLVLDEPTVGLDPVLRRDLWDLFRRLSAEGRTVFVSSHVMDEAVALRPAAPAAGGPHPQRLDPARAARAHRYGGCRAGLPRAHRRGRRGRRLGRGCGGMNVRITADDGGPHPAPAARRPPHRRR